MGRAREAQPRPLAREEVCVIRGGVAALRCCVVRVRGAFPFGLKPQKFVHTQSLPGGAARRSADTGRGCHS